MQIPSPSAVFGFNSLFIFVGQGGTLTSIENPAEQRFIFNNVLVFKDSQPLFWIGMYQTHKGTVIFSTLS